MQPVRSSSSKRPPLPMPRMTSPAGVLAADAPGAASALATPRSESGTATPDATPSGLSRVSPYARPRTPGSGCASARAASPADDVRSVGSAGSGSSGRGGGGLHASASSGSLLDAQLAALPPPESEEEAMHAVPSLLSQLMTGRREEQGAAAARLLSYVQHVGPPVRGALRTAGGVHMLLIMLDSLDRGVREVSPGGWSPPHRRTRGCCVPGAAAQPCMPCRACKLQALPAPRAGLHPAAGRPGGGPARAAGGGLGAGRPG